MSEKNQQASHASPQLTPRQKRELPFWEDLNRVTCSVSPWSLFSLMAQTPEVPLRIPIPTTFIMRPNDALVARICTGLDGKLQIRRDCRETPVTFEMLETNLLECFNSRTNDSHPYICIVYSAADYTPRFVTKDNFSLLCLFLRVSVGQNVSSFGRDEHASAQTHFPEKVAAVQAYIPLEADRRFISVYLHTPVRTLCEVHSRPYYPEAQLSLYMQAAREAQPHDMILPLAQTDPISVSVSRRNASIVSCLRKHRGISLSGIVCEYVQGMDGNLYFSGVLRVSTPHVRHFPDNVKEIKRDRHRSELAHKVTPYGNTLAGTTTSLVASGLVAHAARRFSLSGGQAGAHAGALATATSSSQLLPLGAPIVRGGDDLHGEREGESLDPSGKSFTIKRKKANPDRGGGDLFVLVSEKTPIESPSRGTPSQSLDIQDRSWGRKGKNGGGGVLLRAGRTGGKASVGESRDKGMGAEGEEEEREREEREREREREKEHKGRLYADLWEQVDKLRAEGSFAEAVKILQKAEEDAAAEAFLKQYGKAVKAKGASTIPNSECYRCGDFVFADLDRPGNAYTHHTWRLKLQRERENLTPRIKESDQKAARPDALETFLNKLEKFAVESRDDAIVDTPKETPRLHTLCSICLEELGRDIRNAQHSKGIQEFRKGGQWRKE